METSLSGQRVLVTGARGFIGAHLCRALVALGSSVHGTSRQPIVTADPTGMRWHSLDLGDATGVSELVERLRPDVVFHLASAVTGARDLGQVLPTFNANLASTVHLLAAATRVGCQRFVQAGSLEEPEPGEVTAPASPYAAAKFAASAYARMFHQLYATPVVLARLFMVYGPAQNDEKKLIPYLIRSLLAGESPKLSSGTRPVDWIYVDDVVAGLLRAAVVDGVVGQRVDLGSGALVTIRAVVSELYAQLAPDQTPPFGTLPDRPLEQVRVAQADATHSLLGWHARTPLPEGLAKTIAWYRAHRSIC